MMNREGDLTEFFIASIPRCEQSIEIDDCSLTELTGLKDANGRHMYKVSTKKTFFGCAVVTVVSHDPVVRIVTMLNGVRHEKDLTEEFVKLRDGVSCQDQPGQILARDDDE